MLKYLDEALAVFDLPVVFFGFTLAVAVMTVAPFDFSALNTVSGRIFSFIFAVVLARKDVRLALIWATAFIIVVIRTEKVRALKMPALVVSDNSRLPQTQELDLDKDFPVQQTPDGVLYQATDETEVGKPLHPDLYHSGPQALGDPLPGYEPESDRAPF